MQIPETDNIDYQHAFKRGYRLGLEGKSALNIPSIFRQDMHKRDYFQQGWEQAKEDLKQSDMFGSPTCWRCRMAWIAVMIIGGIATAYHIIYKFEAEQSELALQRETQLAAMAKPVAAYNDDLGLLSDTQRSDLIQNSSKQAKVPLEPLIESPIKIQQSAFSTEIKNSLPEQPLLETIPKYVREVFFFTQIESAKDQLLYHRWYFNGVYFESIPLKINSDLASVWSSKKMSSAWQGQWQVELLNQQQQVIYRKSFIYGKSL